MRLKLIFSILITIFALCGCDKEKPYLYFSSRPITQQTFSYKNIEKVFEVGEKVHFLVLSPKPFESDLARIQIIKKGKTYIYGYSMAHARDIEIKKGSNFFISDFHLHQKDTI